MKCLVGRVIFPTQHLQPHHHSSPMIDRLTMLSQREQLMEDIITIVEAQLPDQNVGQLEQLLCDAVCNNFPAE